MYRRLFFLFLVEMGFRHFFALRIVRFHWPCDPHRLVRSFGDFLWFDSRFGALYCFLLLLAAISQNRKIRANSIYRFIARFCFWCGIAIRFWKTFVRQNFRLWINVVGNGYVRLLQMIVLLPAVLFVSILLCYRSLSIKPDHWAKSALACYPPCWLPLSLSAGIGITMVHLFDVSAVD